MSEGADVLKRLAATAQHTPEALALEAINAEGESVRLTYRELLARAARAAGALTALRVVPGERVVLALPTSAPFFSLYLGCLAAGVIPCVAPPPRRIKDRLTAERAEAACRAIAARLLVVRNEAESAALTPSVPARSLAELIARSSEEEAGAFPLAALPDAIAHLQGTSGTTGTPRHAVIGHRNIAANVRAIGRMLGHRDDDILATWLPMSHDMGLIGLSYAWYWGIPIIAADPANFIRNPLSWLELIARRRASLSPAPNSAFQACCRVARLRPPQGLDLSRWRVALCGAEPVRSETLEEFHTTFARFGFRREALMPVYGLAEATLAVTLSRPDEIFRAERVEPTSLATGMRVAPAGDPAVPHLSITACGRVIPEHELRIVDPVGVPLADGIVGEVECRGPSVIEGYWDEAEDDGLKRDGFLRTGDLGYCRDGELFITGRRKEILILNGRNFSPLQIEAALERSLAAPFTPAVVALAAEDPALRSDALHLLLDSRLGSGGRTEIELRIRQTLDLLFGLRGAGLHWIAGGHIPKTPSGKIQRFRCQALIDAAGSEAEAAPLELMRPA